MKRNPNFFRQESPIIKLFSEKFGFYISLDFRPDEQYPQPGRGNHKQRVDLYLCETDAVCRNDDDLTLCLVKEL